MSTPAQIAANQANAKLSTGATSDAGKKIVSRNSLKYGLCAKVHIALPGEENALEEHVEGYTEAYAPVGLPERDLVRNIAENHFRLQRAHALEHALVTQIMLEQSADVDSAVTEEETWAEKARELKNVTLQARRIQRAIEKNTAALSAMQGERKAAYAKAQEQVGALYKQPDSWARKAVLNVGHSGKFSSDRTIAEYSSDVWGAEPCPVD